MPFISRTDDLYLNRKENRWFCTRCMSHLLPFNHFVENDDFLLAIMENKTTEEVVPLDVLMNMNTLFNPFELNDDDRSPMLDADPDIQYYNSLSNTNLHSCDYYIEDSFNDKLNALDINSNCFSMIHANIRSISKNLGNFECYLEGLSHRFSIIAHP